MTRSSAAIATLSTQLDMKTLTELFDENASWHRPGRGSIAGDPVSRDKVFAQFARYGERWEADA
jgi:hypothetical protein